MEQTERSRTERVDWTNAKGADGPKLVAWLDRRSYTDEKSQNHATWLSSSQTRRIHEWRRGAVANYFTVDALLCALGEMAMDLPQEIWLAQNKRPPRSKGHRPPSAEELERIAELARGAQQHRRAARAPDPLPKEICR